MDSLIQLRNLASNLKYRTDLSPLLFIGHGSPMNGIEDNAFSQSWQQLGEHLDQPSAILVISAHWLTRGTWVTAMDFPRTIHDFGGFPPALYEVQYPAPGSPVFAQEIKEMVQSIEVGLDHEWGLDHGVWTVVRHLYPDASIPVLQLSIDYHQPAAYHYQLAQELKELRKKGVMIIGSGNMVHNLRMMSFEHLYVDDYGYDWAREMHELFKKKIEAHEHQSLIDYKTLSQAAMLAIPTPDHYYPLLYTLGLQDKKEEPEFFNDKLVAGSLNMTSVLFH